MSAKTSFGYGEGIHVADNNSYITVSGNLVNSSGIGLEASGTSVNRIIGLLTDDNKFMNMVNSDGILLIGISNSTISNNYLNGSTGNSGSGIRLESCTQTIVTENNVANFYVGIYEDVGSDFNTISNNNISNFKLAGVIVTGIHSVAENNTG